MIAFQILFFGLLALELLAAIAIKYNWQGLRDKLIRWFKDNAIEDFVQGNFSNKWICQILFIILLLVLCVC